MLRRRLVLDRRRPRPRPLVFRLHILILGRCEKERKNRVSKTERAFGNLSLARTNTSLTRANMIFSPSTPKPFASTNQYLSHSRKHDILSERTNISLASMNQYLSHLREHTFSPSACTNTYCSLARTNTSLTSTNNILSERTNTSARARTNTSQSHSHEHDILPKRERTNLSLTPNQYHKNASNEPLTQMDAGVSLLLLAEV